MVNPDLTGKTQLLYIFFIWVKNPIIYKHELSYIFIYRMFGLPYSYTTIYGEVLGNEVIAVLPD